MTTYTSENSPPPYNFFYFELLIFFQLIFCNFYFWWVMKKYIYIWFLGEGGGVTPIVNGPLKFFFSFL
jgi:hypothetical protein